MFFFARRIEHPLEWLFIARMMAILVNIVGPPRDWTSVAGASHRS
jgi:hypothetical protein